MEGSLSEVANRIIRDLASGAFQEIRLPLGVKDELQKLQDAVAHFQDVLLDAEEMQAHSRVFKDWLAKLKDVLFEADNLLDDVSTEALRRKVTTRNKMAKKVRICFSKSNQIAYGFELRQKIKAIRERLDDVAHPRGAFSLNENAMQFRDRAIESYSFVCAEDVIGRENDKKAIIEILLDPNVQENVSILPIVGIGGVGKTMLAQLVFNDEEINQHFEQKLWVSVSKYFDLRSIFTSILESAKNEKPEYHQLDSLNIELRKEIGGRKYLLVLDDVWNESHVEWDRLKSCLMSGAKGSKILVTTRMESVARIAETIQPYFLRGLNEPDSWFLFKQMAFENGQDPKNSSIKEIGMKIIEKCEGVPLAIRSIGSSLYLKNEEKDWLYFKNNELLILAKFLQTLKLSYDMLPSYLKQCFAYCCLFPKDFKIHKPTLIKMWMAQGFLVSQREYISLEDTGDEYFMSLLQRSFFQEAEEDELGNILHFKIHNLMHDLAKSVAGSDCTTFYSKEEDISEKTFHVSFDRVFLSTSEIPVSLFKASRIKTFLLPSQSPLPRARLDESTWSAIVSSFKFIRLLDLHHMSLKTIPSSIGKLKHLRYLDLSYNIHIQMLPNTITRLQNLQTLRLSECSKLQKLPREINELVKLRHLEIDGCECLTHMPCGLGKLINLHTLSRFVVSKDIGPISRSHGGLKELEKLDELRGTLEIVALKHGEDAALQSKDANLKEKQHLQSLKLKWRSIADESNVGYDEKSLKDLQPHQNLQELCLWRYAGVIFPSWILSLTNLVKFSLENCDKCQLLPSLDQFHSLKSLSLSLMNDLEYISEKDINGGFSNSSILPSLEQLEIKKCPNLKGWWQQQRDFVEEVDNHSLPSFPRLSKLNIWECLKLTSMPLFPYLEKLDLGKCSLKPLEQTMRMQMINMTTQGQLTSIAATSASSSSTPATSSSTPATSSFIPLSKLKYMLIVDMEETLSKELMCNLISIQNLTIESCCGPLPLSRQLTALQNLTIGGSKEVDLTGDGDEMEWHGLQSLHYLKFYSLPNLATLPVGIQHLTFLQGLKIDGCPSLLAIPEWISNLTSLQTLEIQSCPILLERCKRGTGEDWPKIAHIPHLDI